jgi:hypothetical protein
MANINLSDKDKWNKSEIDIIISGTSQLIPAHSKADSRYMQALIRHTLADSNIQTDLYDIICYINIRRPP